MPPAGTDLRLQQLQLLMQYRSMRDKPATLPGVEDVRFDVFSPDGEDGVLLYIFGLIGFKSRRCVDVGGAGITASNTANLIVHHDFRALVLDGNEHGIARTMKAYRRYRPTHPPKCVNAWISRENINAVLAEHSVTGEIDMLSIDLDGVDWWILDALNVIEPRVIVVEYQDILGPDRAWTVPYRPDFSVDDHPVNDGDGYNYCGAGLSAFVKLLRSRGYRLVGCNRTGYNAFFVRSGEGDDLLPEVATESCFTSDWNRYGMAHRFPLVADKEWTTVP
ncbi:hypothetical protein [Mycolicibacterium psychrotolerans]|uniref:Methyltransferase FkbM domain-containing protein n=1 Tax=Mycolicibacterium psychrotolerans TaxID=216929 RepID=A0A7I7MF86_9MYCO|nr:hypothetical protein [Mycolicibacterium psychrotolerans]BBX70974.1 hypothetical protein MPSYJ_44350 [Mycolicibacterium psychrotolerans]